jgi:hypothetical protein
VAGLRVDAGVEERGDAEWGGKVHGCDGVVRV